MSSTTTKHFRESRILKGQIIMNSQNQQLLEIPLGLEAHRLASEFAAEQVNPEKSKQIYLNILVVYAVHRYFKWLGIETSLTQSDSWNPILRNKWNVADLEIPGIGKLECRPFLPGETSVYLPPEVTEDRIGYLGVQFSERLDKVQLLGFTKTADIDVLEIRQLQSIDKLIDRIDKLREGKSPADLVAPSAKLIDKLSPELPVNLGQWFAGVFDEGWQTVETILSPRKLAFKNFREPKKDKIERAKKLDLGLLVNGQEVALIVSIWTEENQEKGVMIQVCSIGEQKTLPLGLKLKVTLESDEAEAIAREADNLIQLEFSELPGKQFTVQVSLDNESITEKFVV
jgi:hypothetical protein